MALLLHSQPPNGGLAATTRQQLAPPACYATKLINPSISLAYSRRSRRRHCPLSARLEAAPTQSADIVADSPQTPTPNHTAALQSTEGQQGSNTEWLPARHLWSALSQNNTNQQGHQHQNHLQHLLSFAAVTLLATPLFGDLAAFPGNITSQPLFVAQALGVLAAIIAVHEAGHFAAARLQGIHVTKFAIGFGPALYTFTRGEVEYSLRAIPLGGYVAFPDDDPNSKYALDDPDLLRNRSIPERAAVISAGVVANIIFAYTSLLIQVCTVGKAETAYLAGITMGQVENSPVAAAAGFKSGDLITRVNDYTVPASSDQVSRVVSIIKNSPGQRLDFTVQRQGAPVLISVVPETTPANKGRLGVQLSPNTYINHLKGSNVGENFAIVNAEFTRLAATVLNGLKSIITNFGGVANQVSGPVAIVVAGADIAKTDGAGLFQFCAIVNLNLAVVNLLPLPALDGGYLLLLAIEAIRGKKLPEKLEQGFMASGFLLLMAMGFSLVVKDTINLLPGL